MFEEAEFINYKKNGNSNLDSGFNFYIHGTKKQMNFFLMREPRDRFLHIWKSNSSSFSNLPRQY